MQPMQRFDSIEGLHSKEPVGAVLTIGRKGTSGAPVETDRFFIVQPSEGDDRVRAQHPAFAAFNGAKPEARQSITCALVHAEMEDSWLHYLRAQVLGGDWPTHPQMKPACQGDGKTALRLYAVGKDGAPDDYREIPCPNDLCEFRQGNVKKCKPFGRLYFRPIWKDGSPLPTPLMKWTTASWNNVAAVKGFFEHVEHQAEQLGLGDYTLYGLPFTITLGKKKKPQQGRAFPVITITPAMDLIAFFMAQRRQLLEAGAGPLALSAGNRDVEEVEAESSDYQAIVPGLPGEVIDVEARVVEPAPDTGEPVVEAPTNPVAAASPQAERPESNGVKLLSGVEVRNLRTIANSAELDADEIAARITGSGLERSPADEFQAIAREIKRLAVEAHAKAKKGGRR